MKHYQSLATLAAVMLMLAMLSFTPAHAKKPDNPAGGGGGGTSEPYSLVDLGGFVGGDFVQAWAEDVNNPDASGLMQVVGDSFAPVPGARDPHAAMWDVTADGQILALTDLHPAGFQTSSADEVNDLGFAIVNHTYIYVPGSGLLTLPGMGGGDGSPGKLDDFGNIFGSAPDTDGVERAAMWHIDLQGQISGPVDLGDPGGFRAWDINNNGVFAGAVGSDAALGWFDDTGQFQVQILGRLGPDDVATAVAINDNGIVAGNSRSPSGFQEAFVWTAATGLAGLGTLGGPGSTATDLNNLGQIVGWSRSDGRFPQVGFVWQDGQLFDLNDIAAGAGGKNWITNANGINDAGHIVGVLTKTKPVSEQHGYLLVPTAEQ